MNIKNLAIILLFLVSSTSALKIHFIDVGQGDATLFEENSNYLLIDCGRSDTKIGSHLGSKGIPRIDYLITTHPDADHIGGCDYVLENFNVSKVRDNGQNHTTQAYKDYITLAKEKDYDVISAGILINWSNITIHVLSPPEPYPAGDLNTNSIVAKVSYGSVDFMLTGDCDTECESSLSGNFSSEILKVGHHGSNGSTSQQFLGKVDPKLAIISVGANNSYGHPAQEVLDRLNSKGIEIHRTDLEGNISILTDGEICFIECPIKGDSQPCNGLVDDFELLNYIKLWIRNLVPDFDLLSAIQTWAMN